MRLAQSGFHATGNGDETRCYSCRKTYRNWKIMDKPDAIHRLISTECPHLNGLGTENISMQSAPETENAVDINGVVDAYSLVTDRHATTGPTVSTPVYAAASAATSSSPSETSLDISRAVYPQYRDLQNRLASYEGWGWSHVQNPQVLAAAGFYYAGYRDCVRCFHCGIGLRTWEKEDDPWVEHVRWRSSCDFVWCMKGEQFVIGALAGHNGGQSGSEFVLPPVTPAQENQHTGTAGNATARAEEMGFQRKAIERAVEELIRSQDALHGSWETTLQNDMNDIQLETLLEKLILGNQEHDRSTNTTDVPRFPPATNTGVSTDPLSVIDRIDGSHDGMHRANEILDEGVSSIQGPGVSGSLRTVPGETHQKYYQENQTTVLHQASLHSASFTQRQLEEENQSLRDESTCKVCLDNLSCIVFLPCGHLVTCAECAPALRKCPICRVLIRGTVRAYNA